jgi:aarF domain-containing kinase
MTDRSPRLRATLRYMVYGREGEFDAENLIDMLQALEKFSAVRNDGDGTAFKVDGVRGNKVVGSAGDFVGSQAVDISDRDTDVGDGRFRISATTKQGDIVLRGGGANGGGADQSDDERTVREALRFFFSPDGEPFREFILEEVANVVDASGRGAILELSRSIGLNNFVPQRSLLRAMVPKVTDDDRRMVSQITKLVQFLLGDFEGSSGNGGTSLRLRRLYPVVREYADPLQDFGLLLVARLTEKSLSRGFTWAADALKRVDRSVGRRTFASSKTTV